MIWKMTSRPSRLRQRLGMLLGLLCFAVSNPRVMPQSVLLAYEFPSETFRGTSLPELENGVLVQSTGNDPQASATANSIDRETLLARCAKAAEFSRQHQGDVMLVMLDGEVIFEDARGLYSTSTPHLLASGTKSFSGIAAALAVHDGFLSLDEKVSDTITEWKQDPRKQDVTVRQLLSLASGLESLSDQIDNPVNRRTAGITDCAEASINARSVAEPGRRFIYGPSSYYVFGELMKRKLKAANTGDADIVAYLERKVFEPLEIEPRFARDQVGNANLPGGGRLSAKDWAVFGEMIRNEGVHDGKQIVDSQLLDELFTAHGPNARYGLTWWLLSNDSNAIEADGSNPSRPLSGRNGTRNSDNENGSNAAEGRGAALRQALRDRIAASRNNSGNDPTANAGAGVEFQGVMAAGLGKQRLYILPEQKLTIVRFGELNGGRGFTDDQFLSLLLSDGE